MTSRFKFRVYVESILPEETGVYEPEFISGFSHDLGIDKVYTKGYKFTSDTSKFTLLQFTGHTSIDDDEVYEGDILQFPDFDGDQPAYIMKWDHDEGAWSIMLEDKFPIGKAGLAQFMKVVGNIYENPELISKELSDV